MKQELTVKQRTRSKRICYCKYTLLVAFLFFAGNIETAITNPGAPAGWLNKQTANI